MIDHVVFLDTGYAIALAAPRDSFHEQAVQIAGEMEMACTRVVTTRAILLEIGNALSGLNYRSAAGELLQALEVDPTVELVSLTDDLYARALNLFRQRPDKEWGLIDCLSYVVMRDKGITEALTTDEHFRQMGFRALLRERCHQRPKGATP